MRRRRVFGGRVSVKSPRKHYVLRVLTDHNRQMVIVAIVIGLGTGVVSGLIGLGGGVFIVPALVYLF